MATLSSGQRFFQRDPTQTGAVATLDWIDRDTARLRNDDGDDAVRGPRVDEVSGKALTVRGFQDVELRFDGYGAQAFIVPGARLAFVLAGLGDDRVALTIGAQGCAGAQVLVDGGGGDNVIDPTFGPAAPMQTIALPRQTVKGGAGDDVIPGQGGTLVAPYEGMFGAFCGARALDGRLVVADLNPADGDEGTDLLLGVSQLQFANTLVGLMTRSGCEGAKPATRGRIGPPYCARGHGPLPSVLACRTTLRQNRARGQSPAREGRLGWCGFVVGAPGFEPGNGGTKIRCLTAWRRPKRAILYAREATPGKRGGTALARDRASC